ncbi:MAG: rhomboid family intramembrane serine protease [Candidatus Bathyarchaeota archaeon]|nr:rhomboid family intramembrane serine protease [Candidatus Bathyarchaeota archaeon]
MVIETIDVPLKKVNWIIILCILVSVFFWYYGSDLTFGYVAFSGENLLEGRVWTLITALFLHGDLLHLLGNILFLFVFGNTVENELGAAKTLLVFFIGGILSFLLSTLFYDPETYLIGASAAIFTLTAVVMLLKPLKFSFLFLMPQGLVAVIYFIYNLFAAYFDFHGNVSYISHVIGFVIGIPFGIAWSEDWVKNLLLTIGLFLLYLLIMLLLISGILGILV